MRPATFAKGNKRTIKNLIALRKQAQTDKDVAATQADDPTRAMQDVIVDLVRSAECRSGVQGSPASSPSLATRKVRVRPPR